MCNFNVFKLKNNGANALHSLTIIEKKIKFKFKLGNQKYLITNWKIPVDCWKNPNNTKEPVKDKQAEFKATNFNNFSSRAGINSKIKIPKIGKHKIANNKCWRLNISIKHSIGFEPMTISLENCCSIQLS